RISLQHKRRRCHPRVMWTTSEYRVWSHSSESPPAISAFRQSNRHIIERRHTIAPSHIIKTKAAFGRDQASRIDAVIVEHAPFARLERLVLRNFQHTQWVAHVDN